MINAHAVRLQLQRGGFNPIPLVGKIPVIGEWQKRVAASEGDVGIWARLYPDARNTGILTRSTPALDIDILDPDAAEAAELVARERFEERGDIHVRFGKSPKRAIFFRTDEFFPKIQVDLIAPNGDTAQKIELLSDGQQVVVDGIHPDTGKPYTWFGGKLSEADRESLPYLRCDDARELVDAIVEVLVAEHGYQRVKPHSRPREVNGESGGDWSAFARIEDHDQLAALAMRLIKSGMNPGAAVNMLRQAVASLTNVDAARQQRRLNEIPGMVASAQAKLASAGEQQKSSDAAVSFRVMSSREFVAGFVPPDYVLSGVLQRRFIYSITGRTGAGKTSLLLLITAHVAEGLKLGDRDVEKGRVLYLAGENPDDIRMRWIAMAQHVGFDIESVDVHFLPGVFKISALQERIRAEIGQIGPVSLIIVDTAAAYFEGDNENDNKQFGDYARTTLRPLTKMPGEPCVLVACHPVKNAGDDNLIPRGGGAFINEVDGNLTARPTSSSVEVHWQGKIRGPDFAPLLFTLRTVTHERLKDSKGRLVPTVIASPLSEQAHEDIARAMRTKEDELLIALLDPSNLKASKVELARRLGWKMSSGAPYSVLVSRTLATLKREKLITVKRGVVSLTVEGKKTAEQACSTNSAKNTPSCELNTSEHPGQSKK